VVLTLGFKVFMTSHILYWCSVFVFLTQITKTDVNNPVPTSQVGLNNSVQFNAFASKAATNAVIVDTPAMI